MRKKRYSNYGGSYGPPTEEEWLNGNSGSGLLSGGSTTTTTGSWTSQNTVDVINTGAGLVQTVLTSIFGRNNIQQAQYTNELYKQEQRTNTILWVVLGLVLALGVFLVIRKTK